MNVVLGNTEKRDVWGQWVLQPIDTFVPFVPGTNLFDLSKAPREVKSELAKINKARKIVSLLRSGRLGQKITEVREWDVYGPAYPRPGAGRVGKKELLWELREKGEKLIDLPVNPQMDSDTRLAFYRLDSRIYAVVEGYMGSSWGADFDSYEIFLLKGEEVRE